MIEAARLAKSFGSADVLADVSFSVPKGQSYVVLGASGSGKSVLLKILAGLLTPDSGHVRIQSQNVGMLFQNNALFDSLTVRENLAFPLKERLRVTGADATRRIEELLAAVGLPGTGDLMPSSLSGGMQKRLGIARALIVEPQVLLYDEPTAGLDPITSRMIADLIIELRRRLGTTVVAVTSDVMRAFQLADRMGLLVPGPNGARLQDVGTPAEARQATDEAVVQFLKGLPQGPLTADADATPMPRHADHDPVLELDHDPF